MKMFQVGMFTFLKKKLKFWNSAFELINQTYFVTGLHVTTRVVMDITNVKCVVPENIHTSPTEGIFSKTPQPLWKFQLKLIHSFKFFGLKEPPSPKEIPIPSVGRVWIFSGTAQCTLCCKILSTSYKP